MGRRDEVQSEQFAKADADRRSRFERKRNAIMCLHDVQLSRLSVGELMLLIRTETRGLKRDYGAGDPSEAEIIQLERMVSMHVLKP